MQSAKVSFDFSDRPKLVELLRVYAAQTGRSQCMVTSQLDGFSFAHDYVLADFAAAGLPKPSLVRIAKLVTVEQSMLVKRLGKLGAVDRSKVRDNLRMLFRLD